MAELVTKRYAAALFDIANEKGAMETFEKEALEIIAILKQEEDYMAMLSHPTILIEEKIDMVEKAFSTQVADEFVGLMVLLIKKNRQSLLVDILEMFAKMAKEAGGMIRATVTSAIQLKEEQLAQIKANIEQNTGKQVDLHVAVDAALIGGMIVRVGDKVVDGSVRGQMEALSSKLRNLRLA